MGFFITNQNELVKDTINNVLPSSDQLFFLVGYFYFSGFQLIYKNITLEQKLKILVGLQAESRISNYIEFSSSQGFPPAAKRRQCWYYSLQDILGHSKEYDNQESLEAFNLFINKLKNGTLEVRQTKNPCHAKMYIFQNAPKYNQNGNFVGTTIIGSSNLSATGLEKNLEINTQHRENPFVEESLIIFDELWKESQILADITTLPELQTELIDKLWFSSRPSPFLIYLKVLIEYFDVKKIDGIKTPSQVLGENFNDLQYQVDAIEQGVRSINEHNGVIVADVVGLGKSIIATTIAANFNLPVLVIAPPHLKPQWEDYCAHLNVNNRVFSSGKIEDALEYSYKLKKPFLVVLDEAHNYRNPATQDYSDLETLCRGNKIIALSATPFNNKPEDIFSLVRLFQIPTCSTLKTVDNLADEIQKIKEEYDHIDRESADSSIKYKQVAKKIRWLISEVVIRRNREDLKNRTVYREDLKKNHIEIPHIEEPKLEEYSFGEFSTLYLHTLELLAGEKSKFKAARYRVVSYVVDEFRADVGTYLSIQGDPQKNNATFLKRLLVRRLESSINAFNKTLDNIIASTEKTLSFLKGKHRALVSKKTTLDDLEDLTFQELDEEWNAEYETVSNSISNGLFGQSISRLSPKQEEELANKGIYLIHEDLLKPEFERDLENDIHLLKQLKEGWSRLTSQNDPKLARLKEIVHRQMESEPHRKIVLFSQFADTIEYLKTNLPKDNIIQPVAYNASCGKRAKEEIRANFDASYPKKEQENKYNLLLTTDALSEGINLNRAGTVFNYDIPYNPTRVIQRVGRINRINRKVFPNLFIYNFFPTEIGEMQTNVKKITTNKMAMIDLIFGEDTKYLTPGETIKASLSHLPQNEAEEEISWDTKYREFLDEIRKYKPELYEQADNLPSRVRIARKTKEGNALGVLVFGRRGDVGVFSFCDKTTHQTKYLSDEDAIKLFEATSDEKSLATSPEFYSMYNLAQEKMIEEIYAPVTQHNRLIGEAKQVIARLLLNSTGDDSKYLQNLDDILADGLCAAKLQIIKKNGRTYNDNVQKAVSLLRESIPEQYVNTVIDIQKHDKSQNITVVLSVEFIGQEEKGVLL